MREQYLTPELTRVGSVEDLTLASGTGSLIDICITIGGGQILIEGAIPGGVCS